MIREHIYNQTVCDACGKIKQVPIATSGYYVSGWEKIEDKDLCDICYGLFMYKVIDSLKEDGTLDKRLQGFIEGRPPHIAGLENMTFC